VVDAVNKGWLWEWEKKRFKKKKNPDLWIRFIAIYKQLKVELVWVKGHANIPENERCDELAVEASKGKNLQKDVGYEDENEGLLNSFL
jgi:ribonuclease HI